MMCDIEGWQFSEYLTPHIYFLTTPFFNGGINGGVYWSALINIFPLPI